MSATFPEKLIAAKSIADNEFSFAAPDGHFARVSFSLRYTPPECRKFAEIIAAQPKLLAALSDLVEIDRRDGLTDPDQCATDAWREEAMRNARAVLAATKTGGA